MFQFDNMFWITLLSAEIFRYYDLANVKENVYDCAVCVL